MKFGRFRSLDFSLKVTCVRKFLLSADGDEVAPQMHHLTFEAYS